MRNKHQNKLRIIISFLLSIILLGTVPVEPSFGTTSWDFSYTGSQQTFTVPTSGKYKLEVWGAQGGGTNGGFGGYASGEILLAQGQTLALFIGGNNGYNGGGIGTGGGYNGGGASDIRINGTALTDRIIVAGGGGGAGLNSPFNANGGAGGGTSGFQGSISLDGSVNKAVGGLPGTQTGGYALGVGQNGSNSTKKTYGAGGGGYYGGCIGTITTYTQSYIVCMGGGGGSGYLSTHLSNGVLTNAVQSGNGKIKLTLADSTIVLYPASSNNNVYSYNYTGAVQTFSVPLTGQYKIEAWGAQGGGTNGGLGGYASGEIALTQGQMLSLYVGGNNGYNGGGTGTGGAYNGGGSSDIRINGTALTDRIIVAGGGGGAGLNSPFNANGGAGGGTSGLQGSVSLDGSVNKAVGGLPGTQTGGYALGVGQNGSNSTKKTYGAGGGGYYGGCIGTITSYTQSYIVCMGGGGGSGYISASFTFTQMLSGVQSGDGAVKITYISPIANSPQITALSGTQLNVQGTASDTWGVMYYLYNKNSADITSWVTSNNYVDSGLSPNTMYSYKYKAKNSLGYISEYSVSASKYTLAFDPTSVSITSRTATTASITIQGNTLNGQVKPPEYLAEIKLKGTGPSGANVNTPSWSSSQSLNITGLSSPLYYDVYLTTRNGDGVQNAKYLAAQINKYNTTPSINNTTIDNQIISANSGYTNVNVSGTVQDIDIGDTLKIYYRVDGTTGAAGTQLGTDMTANGSLQAFMNSLNLSSLLEGTHTIYFWVQDNKGFCSPEVSSHFTIDKSVDTAPQIKRNTDSTITIIPGTDSVSGVKSTLYKLEGAINQDWTNYTGSISIPDSGNTQIFVKTIDNVGNETEVVTLNENAITVTNEKLSNLTLKVTDIDSFTNCLFNVNYDPQSITITDLCEFTYKKELITGAIAGTDVEIVSFTEGNIVFKINKVIPQGQKWSGIVNSIECKGNKTGQTPITFTIN